MKTIFLFSIILFVSSCARDRKENTAFREVSAMAEIEKKPAADFSKLERKAEEALQFCSSKNLNTDFCILIDMSLHSGVNRFFIWNFKNNSVSGQYLVGHGCGSNLWSRDHSKDNPEFSNEDGSHLSSLGKYKLQGRGYSEWGINIKYLMHGLEDTNTNALKRFIVFHSWDQMSDKETFPKGSPEGWGCPTVSNNAMREIDPMIQKAGKPVLMWIFN